MSKRPESYIGVSGVVNPAQQQELEDYADQLNFTSIKRRLALGVKAVHKTQFLDIPNRYGEEWYPVGQQAFEDALSPGDGTSISMGVAQTYLDSEYVDNPGYRTVFSERIMKRGEKWLDGIQFDLLPWQDRPEMFTFLERLKTKFGKKILLQCHNDAMEGLGPYKAIKQLGEHGDLIDYVLFDASHGTGTKLDTGMLRLFLDEAYRSSALASTGIAIAGGLDAETVREALPVILADFPDTSWDAEGRLHPVNTAQKRPLNMTVVRDYMQASQEVIVG